MTNSQQGPIIQALQQGRYEDAERMAADLLVGSPLDAQGWVFLGESLMRRQYGSAAQKAFNRGWILDPEAAWVQGVNAELRRTEPGEERPDIDSLFKVEPVTVTAAIIAKDEARTIERCLASLQDAVDEIIVMDSGSTDGTPELAQKFPKVRLYRTEWKQSFAELRNEALRQVKTDWVLWVDADEWLSPDDAPFVREIAGMFHRHTPPALLQIWQVNHVEGAVANDFSMVRMFPLGHGLKYWGRIHEQVGSPAGAYEGAYMRRQVRIRLLHDGYDIPVMQQKNKLERNLTLLQLMMEEEPDNPGWAMFAGRETLASGRPDEALELLRQAERLAAKQPRFGRMLDVQMLQVKIHMMNKNWEDAERICRAALKRQPDFPDASFYLAQIRMSKAGALLREAEQLMNQTKQNLATYRGMVAADQQISGWRLDLLYADLCLHTGHLANARDIYSRYAHKLPKLDKLRKRIAFIDQQQQKLTPRKTLELK